MFHGISSLTVGTRDDDHAFTLLDRFLPPTLRTLQLNFSTIKMNPPSRQAFGVDPSPLLAAVNHMEKFESTSVVTPSNRLANQDIEWLRPFWRPSGARKSCPVSRLEGDASRPSFYQMNYHSSLFLSLFSTCLGFYFGVRLLSLGD